MNKFERTFIGTLVLIAVALLAFAIYLLAQIITVALFLEILGVLVLFAVAMPLSYFIGKFLDERF